MLHYHRVNVFTSQPFGGNPLAVFLNPGELSDETMQKIAKEFNLSEVTFVTPSDKPDSDFRVRIFTPTRELPMAGHPTVGTAYVLQREGLIPATGRVRFLEGVGVIDVALSQVGDLQLITMQQPDPKFGATFADRALVAQMLSLDESDFMDAPVQAVSCGVPFAFVPIKTLSAIRRIRVRTDIADRLHAEQDMPGEVFAFTLETELPGSTVHSRMFAPLFGIPEDPATGAASGPLGCYLVKHGLVSAQDALSIVSEQGIEMGRPSIIQIRIEVTNDAITDVDIGGSCVYMGSGMLQV